MESKLNSRSSNSVKKVAFTASGVSVSNTTADKKKKRKKNKTKHLLKGRESKESGIHSPDFDSEVHAEGDSTLTDVTDGDTSPTGRVTKLPLLASQSSVSLTTQPSLPTSQNQKPASAAPLPASVASASRPAVETISTRMASMAVKRPSVKSRSKSQHPGRSTNPKSSRHKTNKQGRAGTDEGPARHAQSEEVQAVAAGTGEHVPAFREVLRWEYVSENTEQERQRLTAYKVNRRKRYLAAAQAKGLGWAINQPATPSPQSEDSGVETVSYSSGNFAVFRTLQSLRPLQAPGGLTEALVKC